MVDGIDQTYASIKLSQEQCTGIRGQAATIEISLNFFAGQT
jgi:hypothetical protein